MCCLPCSFAFKQQLVPVLALGSVPVLVHEQHLLLRLVLLLLLRLLMQFHVGVPAVVAGLDAVSAILCAACLVPVH